MALPQLEVSLRQGGDRRYEVELRFWSVGDDGDFRRAGRLPAGFEPSELPSLRDDAEAYGRALGAALLSDSDVSQGFADAQQAAGTAALRVRLSVNSNAAALGDLAWESARDPRSGALLFVGDRCVFSRYSTTADSRSLYRRARSDIRVLIAVASPKNIAEFSDDRQVQLAAIDEDTEIDRVVAALPGVRPPVVLRSSQAPVTLQVLGQKLSRDVDVFYLVCHGTLVDGSPLLFLDAADGSAVGVSADDFVNALGSLRTRPRLVVLASCRGGGAGPDAPYGAGGSLQPLATRLANEAGIPAVIAMQGDIALATVNEFVTRFFQELAEDGIIDRAMGMARYAVTARGDWWAPALFTRLRTGEMWYRSGFDANGDEFTIWPAISNAIRDRNCIPILGPGLLERLIGTRRDLAVELARNSGLPIPVGERDILSFIAQYRAVEQDPATVRRELLSLLVEQVRARFGDDLPAALAKAPAPNTSPEELVTLVRTALAHAAAQEKNEPHTLLAKLPFNVFITTNPDHLLEDALARVRDAEPVVECNSWSVLPNQGASIFDLDKSYTPSFERPYVYHFFGRADHENSVAITQDQFLDSLISASRLKAVPDRVRGNLVTSTLLFLGFKHDDWAFRTLFRFITQLEGALLLKMRDHVAVQLDPDDQPFDDPRITQRYLSRYLGKEKITLYFGRVDEFIRQLTDHVNPAAPGVQ